jgi:macrolide transport system ATP-binding/permease protein
MFIQDLRYALRQVRRAPGFFACAALLIAIGIAANTQIFTLVNALLLRPLPVRDPGNLVQLFDIRPKVPPNPYYANRFYKDFVKSSSTLFSAVGQIESVVALEQSARADRVHVCKVTDNYFRDLGVEALLGRVLGRGDDHTVVLSYAYWSRAFGRDAGAIGQKVKLHGHAFTIVGVASREFNGTVIDSSPDLWMPFANTMDLQNVPNPDMDRYPIEIIARLRPGVTITRAQEEATLFYARYLRQQSGDNNAGRLEVRSIANGLSPLRDQSRAGLILLLAGTGVLMLMVCANVGGLLLARSIAREKEAAVRLAIGASRMRIVAQNLTDGLLVTAMGGLAGWLLAAVTMPLLLHLMPPARGIGFDPQEIRSLTIDIRPDLKVAALSLAMCALAAVLCALAPAWRSTRSDILMALKNTMSEKRHGRFQSALCGLQVALCTLLIFSAGLMVRSLSNLRTSDTGFDPAHVVIFSLDTHIRGYDSGQAWVFRRRLLASVKALPGVDGTAISGRALMRGIGLANSVVFPGQRGDGIINSSTNSVTPDYFDVMSIRRLAGRGFAETDLPEKGKLTKTIVNEAFVKKFLSGRNPVGAQFGSGPGIVKPGFEIIGVVGDTKYRSLREIPPPIFYTYNLGPAAYPESFVLHVRTHRDPHEMIQPVLKLLKSIDSQVPVYQVATLSEEIDRSLWQERLLVALTTSFGLFAMLLSMIGLYGVLAYFVVRRRREIGVRMALGAQTGQVVWLVVKRLIPTLCMGLLAGAALSALAAGWVRNLLYGIQPLDPSSAGTALLLMMGLGVAGAVAPALRAVRVDPASALRQD